MSILSPTACSCWEQLYNFHITNYTIIWLYYLGFRYSIRLNLLWQSEASGIKLAELTLLNSKLNVEVNNRLNNLTVYPGKRLNVRVAMRSIKLVHGGNSTLYCRSNRIQHLAN